MKILDWLFPKPKVISYWATIPGKEEATRILIPSIEGNTLAMMSFFANPTKENEEVWVDRGKGLNEFSVAFRDYWKEFWKNTPQEARGNSRRFAQWMIEYYPSEVGKYIEENKLARQV